MTQAKERTFTYYPGCSSQGSARHLDESLRAVLPKVGVELDEIDDWNCCGASVGHIGGCQKPNLALTGRTLAKAQQKGTRDVVTGCAACYLNTHGGAEKIRVDVATRLQINVALREAQLSYDAELRVRHVCEVLVNDVGIDRIAAQVTNPLHGLKVASYVGCQTVRPFAATDGGGNFDATDEPTFLDDFSRACGAVALPFSNKTSCCGASVAVMSPERTLPLIQTILAEAQDAGADVISTPCPLCQTNVEMYQAAINKTFGTNFHIPVVFYSQLMAVAFGMDAKKDAALQRNTIVPTALAALAQTRPGGAT
ncbi:MAG TPA: CoB--CoM heterodisulfide reductase iron-sulfur subunit B family protein [Burkholderiaceae bacterium]|nr:CoB--CoM heterodisulfide reductase iron-sulfur subunit B family protein [Burkholderiaceae bacterium]